MILEACQSRGAARIGDRESSSWICRGPGGVDGLQRRRGPGEAGIIAEQIGAAADVRRSAEDRMIQRIQSIHAELDAALLTHLEVLLHREIQRLDQRVR